MHIGMSDGMMIPSGVLAAESIWETSMSDAALATIRVLVVDDEEVLVDLISPACATRASM
jgi:hypothetical protein